MERRDKLDKDIAKTKGSSTLTSSTYIAFLTKLQKKANPVKLICPIEK